MLSSLSSIFDTNGLAKPKHARGEKDNPKYVPPNFRLGFSLFASWLTVVNVWSFLRGQPHSPDVNHCVLSMFDPKVTRSFVTGLDP